MSNDLHDGKVAQEVAVSKFLLDVIPIASSQVGEDEMISRFTKAVSAAFGIDAVALMEAKKVQNQVNALHDYIINTKKTYIDNQLSEYSSFPELINYKNNGFRSCAVMPLVADGKVVSFLEMLSKDENKFSDELIKDVAFGASLIGFVLMYKGELGRSTRLATYFDAAFNNQFPQLIVAEDGTVVKFNKAAVKLLGVSVPETRKVDSITGIGFKKLLELSAGAGYSITLGNRVYQIVVGKINDRLVHIAANDITDAFVYSAMNAMVANNDLLCIVTTDNGLRITNVSQNAEKIFGFSKSVLVGGSLIDMTGKVAQSPFGKGFADSFKKDSDTGAGAVTFELGENGRRHMRYLTKRFLDGYIFLLVNAETEKYVDDVRKDLDDFISGSSDIVLGVDGMGYIRDCNIHAEDVLGFKKEEMIGRDVRSIYKEQGALDKDITHARNGQVIDNSFVYLVGKNQETLIPATHAIRLLHAPDQDNGIEYLIILRELATKRKVDDQESYIRKMEGRVKGLETQGSLKSQFIYNISHELKTPLTSIKGYSKLLYDGESGPLNEEQKAYLKITLDEADRLTLIIQQILDAAKLEAEKVKLELKDVDLSNMGENPSIKALEESALGKGLEFRWEVKWDVPKINADPNRLIQIFVNLVGNAIKFTDKGSITVGISRLNAKTVLCKVTDTGIGLSEDDKQKLMRKRKFYEIKKSSANTLVQQPGAGTGLGLAITKDLVRLHGGNFKIESALGKGSTFMFTLPIVPRQKRRRAQAQQNGP